MKTITASEALKVVESGHNIFIHTAAAAPQELIRALTARGPELRAVKIYQLHTEGIAPYADEIWANSFEVNALFIGPNVRKAVQAGRASYIPIFLSEAPLLFRKNYISIDVALISVSPPDKHGYCSLGVSIDTSLAAVENAQIVIAQINRNMPRTHGDGIIHMSQINFAVEFDEALPEVPPAPIAEVERKIGEFAASLIEDGSTLQMGIGAIPNAVLSCLGNHKNLGIHSEMFSDGVLPLLEKGVINGREKVKHPGKVIASFVMGTKKLYDFIDDNPLVVMRDAGYVNLSEVIRKNPKVVAINSAIEIDLTGQVCADSIGTLMYSGVGGQMDFIKGASLSYEGKPIIALPSTTGRGESRIVSCLKMGAGVVTTRAHVHYIITEYGIANLYGKNLKERAKLLIGIAHPNHREELERAAREDRCLF
jgi:4-hydroxybutyrate CoA-transferase